MTRRIRREACLHCHIVPTARQNRRRMGFPDPNVMSVEMKATLARWRKSAQTPRGLDLACRDAEGRMWAHREDDERALQSQGRLDEAAASYERALALKPGLAEARNNLGTVLNDLGRFDEAVACYQQALRLGLDVAEAHANLGNALLNPDLLT